MIGRLDAAIGPIKQRRRGRSGAELLVGIAAAQLAGEDFWVGLDRQRADTAGQQLAPVPDLAATTAAGLARKFHDGQWYYSTLSFEDQELGMLRGRRVRLR